MARPGAVDSADDTGQDKDSAASLTPDVDIRLKSKELLECEHTDDSLLAEYQDLFEGWQEGDFLQARKSVTINLCKVLKDGGIPIEYNNDPSLALFQLLSAPWDEERLLWTEKNILQMKGRQIRSPWLSTTLQELLPAPSGSSSRTHSHSSRRNANIDRLKETNHAYFDEDKVLPEEMRALNKQAREEMEVIKRQREELALEKERDKTNKEKSH